MIVITSRAEAATIDDLLLVGWRRDQVADYAEDARSLAHTRQNGIAA